MEFCILTFYDQKARCGCSYTTDTHLHCFENHDIFKNRMPFFIVKKIRRKPMTSVNNIDIVHINGIVGKLKMCSL